ncbi:MAG: hypothetical protein JWM81_702 [Candidatus Saccharibacteria bacterium]|nr:hypothetical protein [Candidatus Saccharibacteria bacterium]
MSEQLNPNRDLSESHAVKAYLQFATQSLVGAGVVPYIKAYQASVRSMTDGDSQKSWRVRSADDFVAAELPLAITASNLVEPDLYISCDYYNLVKVDERSNAFNAKQLRLFSIMGDKIEGLWAPVSPELAEVTRELYATQVRLGWEPIVDSAEDFCD